jgi:hypothetical protein
MHDRLALQHEHTDNSAENRRLAGLSALHHCNLRPFTDS